jgi:hypothetical protein
MRYPLEYSDEYAGTVTFAIQKSASSGGAVGEGNTDMESDPSGAAATQAEEEATNPPESPDNDNTDTRTEDAETNTDPTQEEHTSFDGQNEEQQSISNDEVQVDGDATEGNEGEEAPEENDEEGGSENPPAQSKAETNTGGGVTLYLPPGLQYRDNVVYDAMDLGFLGGITADKIRGASNATVGQIARGAGGSVVDSIQNLITQIRTAATEGGKTDQARLGMTQLATLIPDQGVRGAIKNELGVTANPNTRVLFNKVNLREFQFAFKMIARSQKEAKAIQAIIQFFRESLYPETFDVAGVSGLGYKFPDKFDITIDYGGEWKAPKIKESYLRDVSTTFNASTMAILPGGEPLEVDLTLSFIEAAALEKKDIKSGY